MPSPDTSSRRSRCTSTTPSSPWALRSRCRTWWPCPTTSAWPHEPAAVDYHTTEGRSWRLWLSADGARTARLPDPGTRPATVAGENRDAADASAEGTASELVLTLYGRIPVDSLKLDGDRRLFDQLIAWDPDE